MRNTPRNIPHSIFPATFVQPYDYPMTDPGREHLPRSPRNAVREPVGKDRKDGRPGRYTYLAALRLASEDLTILMASRMTSW